MQTGLFDPNIPTHARNVTSSLFSNRMGSIAPFIPVKIENSTWEIASATLNTLFLCREPKYKSAAAACVLLFLRNVTRASHAPYNIYTTREERSERKMARSTNPLK